MKPTSVILIDDNQTFLNAATQFLDRQDKNEISVLGSITAGEDALKLVQEQHPDVVLLDLSMPGMSGIDMIPILKDGVPDAAIIIVTLLDTLEYRKASIAAGADAFVSKAMFATELIPTIQRVVG